MQDQEEMVSIIIPCFNDGKYIKEAINSVLSQTYKNFEIIIINDGSDDLYTNKILATNLWPKTTIYHIMKSGPSVARNYGIKRSRGIYILPLDADDKIAPDYINQAVGILRQSDSIGIVYCYADFFDKMVGRWELPHYSLKNILLDNIIFVSALFRKSDWERVGGFDEDLLPGMEDYDLWLSIIETGKDVYQIPETLFYYRIKNNSRTYNFYQDINIVNETYEKIFKKHEILFLNNFDLYQQALREALILKIYQVRLMKKFADWIIPFHLLEKYKPIIKKWMIVLFPKMKGIRTR